jgi:tight adherence protein C
MNLSLNEITAVAFSIVTIMVYLIGATVVRARKRVRNIKDVDKQFGIQRVGWLRKSLAESIPQPANELERLNQDLKRAGYYGANASIEFRAMRNLLILLITLLGMGAAIAANPGSELPKWLLLITLLSAVAAYALPRFILHSQASRRLDSIQRGLPDALDIIRMCLAGGLPLRDALNRVSREVEFFHSDVAVELEVVRRHAEMDTMGKALREFSARMNAPDVNALASLVTQSERTGTNVADAVTEFSDGIRQQFRHRAEERAQKTSIRMLFPVLLCLAPPVIILLLGPPAIQLRTFLQDARNPGGVLDVESDPQSTSQRLIN